MVSGFGVFPNKRFNAITSSSTKNNVKVLVGFINLTLFIFLVIFD